MTTTPTTFFLASALLALGCSGQALDLGNDGATGSAGPPRAPNGSIDETIPWTIATERWGPDEVAVANSRVYWTAVGPPHGPDKPSIRGCSLDDCAGTLTTYAKEGAAGLAIGHSNLFWTAGGWGVRACSIQGCGGGPRTIDSRPAPPDSIVQFLLDDSYLYWTLQDATVQRCPLAGCSADAELVGLLSAAPTHFVADSATLYVSTSSGTRGTIVAMPKDGSEPVRTIVEGAFKAAGLAVNGEHIYWTDTTTGTVSVCPLSGCTGDPVVLATHQAPGDILVDSQNAYWITNVDAQAGFTPWGAYSALVECSVDGCGDSPTVLVASLIATGRLVQDDTHLYFTTLAERWGVAKEDSLDDVKGSTVRVGNSGVNRIAK